MSTILITGCSSGFGLDTARHFLERGWDVIATMRTPKPGVLPASDRLRVLPLDVTKPDSIRALADAAGPIDALVNNAGIGLASIVEGTSLQTARAIFETNLFGALAVTQAFLPRLRERKGVIVNVSSSVTHRPLPLLAIYSASKAALNAFTESLALELAPQGVRVRLVLPGQAPETPFGQNAQAHMREQGVAIPEPYAAFVKTAFDSMMSRSGPLTRASDVSEAIWRAVTDPSAPMRQPAGADSITAAQASSRNA
ncbi:MAG TPA: SDR family oxidoreductase [Kofleriaceae bacterium]|jgi:NAD(P)-dependent dehydrogenase (short-subunit alcohol dehydrogenase family)|nr:SDR family oxidoreductase [Kofleriaceae bacterium]